MQRYRKQYTNTVEGKKHYGNVTIFQLVRAPPSLIQRFSHFINPSTLPLKDTDFTSHIHSNQTTHSVENN